MLIVRIIFYPFTFLYFLILRLRNLLYDLGIFKVYTSSVPSINVGNLTVGGTGKTPHIEFLIDKFSDTYQIVVLSRGYGRKTKGLLWATAHSSAQEIGDEPYQIWNKYHSKIKVVVCEKRVVAIQEIESLKMPNTLILLDDAYQHRAIKPAVNILLNDYNRKFYEDYLLPFGKLREYKAGVNRADIVLNTKCPVSISENEKFQIKNKILSFHDKASVYFTSIVYGHLFDWKTGEKQVINKQAKVVGFSGLANNKPFENYLNQNFDLKYFESFPDHYEFSEKDFLKLVIKVKDSDAKLMTTEKDASKLISFSEIIDIELYVVPVKVHYIEHESEFCAEIEKRINNLY